MEQDGGAGTGVEAPGPVLTRPAGPNSPSGPGSWVGDRPVRLAARANQDPRISPKVFSRTRRQVIEAGWLEESERLAHIHYYRLSPKATGENVVVEFRRAT